MRRGELQRARSATRLPAGHGAHRDSGRAVGAPGPQDPVWRPPGGVTAISQEAGDGGLGLSGPVALGSGLFSLLKAGRIGGSDAPRFWVLASHVEGT